IGAGLGDGDRRRGVVVDAVASPIHRSRRRADRLARAVVFGIRAGRRIRAVERERDRAGRIAGAARERGGVGEINRRELASTEPVRATGIGGQRRVVPADDDGLVRAGAAGRVVVVVAGGLGLPGVGTRLGGHVAAGLGGAVGAVVGAVARDRNPGGAVDGRAQVGAVVARLEQVEADRAAGIRGGQGEAGVVGQRVADLAGGLARGRPERGRVEADDDGLVRAGAAGRVVVVVAGVLGQPVVGTRLGGHVAAGLGGAVGAVVGAVARDRNPGGAVDGRAQVGAVVARLEQVEADRPAGIRGGQG